MPRLTNQLELPRCPHCRIDRPRLDVVWQGQTSAHSGENTRFWAIYRCATCGGIVTASAGQQGGSTLAVFPAIEQVDDSLPDKAKKFLEQSQNSLHAPAGSVMLAASAVDAMLKTKGYKEGSLFARINKAAEDHLITSDMAKWAHQVRIGANDQRHADDDAGLPDEAEARRCIDFAAALGMVLFALPARVEKGLKEASDS